MFLRILNVGLRGIPLVVRTLFLLLLAKHVSPETVGLFGLLNSLILTIVVVASLDTYTIIIRTPKDSPDHTKFTSSYLGIVIISSIVGALISFAVALENQVSTAIAALVGVACLLEQWAHETNRMLEGHGHTIKASMVQFIRSTPWPFIALIYILSIHGSSQEGEELFYIFLFWSIFSIVAVASFGFPAWSVLGKVRPSFNVGLMRDLVVNSGRMFAASIALRLGMFSNVFLVGYFWNNEFLGKFVFFYAIFNGGMALSEAAVFSFKYPLMIRAAQNGEWKRLEEVVRELVRLSVFFFVFLTALVLVFVFVINVVAGYEAYADSWWIACIMLVSVFVMNMSYPYHYVIYAMRDDRWALISHSLGFFSVVLTSWAGFMAGSEIVSCAGILVFALVQFVVKRARAKWLILEKK